MRAQTFTTLHNFAGHPNDGAGPVAALTLSGNALYGTTGSGGSNFYGTIFKVNTDGTDFTNLYNFNFFGGEIPRSCLILLDGILYGTTVAGSASLGNDGTVFAINADGTDYSTLYSFSGSDGFQPAAGLILSSGTLYGTTYRGGLGGNSGSGTIFSINTDGSDFANVYDFGNDDGVNPEDGLVSDGNTFYGTTYNGGASGFGTIFEVNINGTDFNIIHSFTTITPNDLLIYTNSDGANPSADLTLSGNVLYGTTYYGGSSGSGSLFKINTDGTGFTNLYSFSAFANNGSNIFTNSDGRYPAAGLVLSGNTLYGTASGGGSSGNGTVFEINADGSDFTVLHMFTMYDQTYYTNSDGAYPQADLILSGNILYGTASTGGNGYGTVFALTLPSSTPAPIPLNFALKNGQLVLSWNDPTFALQSASSLTGSWTNLSSASSPYTNKLTGAQVFFRLVH